MKITPSKKTPAPFSDTGVLRSLKDLEGYKISATDGDIGKVHDFLFDDEFWIIRYAVVDTGHWLPRRKVLLTPGVLLDPNLRDHSFSVALTREQVKVSPDIDTDKPVSRQREIELHQYFGWTFYWPPSSALPGMLPPPVPTQTRVKETGDPHLQSVREVTGYNAEATDGDVGRVDDFVADIDAWAVRYLVVTTHKWLPGRKVLISPHWLVGPINWNTKQVKIIMSRENIKHSPEFNPSSPVNREYEGRLFDYYGRPTYWNKP